ASTSRTIRPAAPVSARAAPPAAVTQAAVRSGERAGGASVGCGGSRFGGSGGGGGGEVGVGLGSGPPSLTSPRPAWACTGPPSPRPARARLGLPGHAPPRALPSRDCGAARDREVAMRANLHGDGPGVHAHGLRQRQLADDAPVDDDLRSLRVAEDLERAEVRA